VAAVNFSEVGMRITFMALLVALALVPSRATAVAAQVGRAAIGGAVGVAGGAVITLSIVVARARFQSEYLEGVDDLIHWQSAPMLLTPAVGVMFGLAGSEPLKGSVIGSTAGMVVGAAVGAGVGWLASEHAEGPWAGAVIGAGAGMTAGGLLLGIRSWVRRDSSGGEDAEPVRIGVRIPL
jgi:hypothetical protein